MTDLFGPDPAQANPKLSSHAPLADQLRPTVLADIIGQEHLTGPEGAIGRMVASGRLSSMVLWGPPGTGKTSIARLLADAVGMHFLSVSAVFSGVADLKKSLCRGRTSPTHGQSDVIVRGRNPSFQPRSTGWFSALC
jgi:putative ATPase